MSYAIIRNEKFTKIALKGIYRHNERKNNTYSNKDINYLKRYSNYHIKQCNRSYWKEFDYIREKNQLKGFIKSNSIVACEYIITSDKEFFDSIGEKETKRYFETAYEFIKKFKNLGDEYIISATVHLDESTPHMHLVYIPVIHKKDEKSGKIVDKVCASEFWKGQLSYKKLQDEFYEYIKSKGFDLERGMTKDNKHYQPEDLKKITNYEMQELFKDSSNLELEVQSDDIEVIKENYRIILKKYNAIVKRYERIKTMVDKSINNQDENQETIYKLNLENERLENELSHLENYIKNTKEWISVVMNWNLDRVERFLDNYSKLRIK